MKIIEVQDYAEMSQRAAEYIIEKIKQNPQITLGLATGGTPVGTYQRLIDDHQQNGTSYREITTFNLDEYVGLSGDNKNSYRYFMDEQLFNHVNINKEKTHVPSGISKDLAEECQQYEQSLDQHGGIDLQVLGIGSNGHIGFNEPGTSFQTTTHVVDLAPSTIEANARFFNSVEEVPTKAVTMGIATIMKSKEILLLVSGESKNAAVQELLNGEVTEEFPASILKNHPGVTIIADKAAVSGLKLTVTAK